VTLKGESDREVLNVLRLAVNRYERALNEIIEAQEHSDDCFCGIKDAVCIACIAETALNGGVK